MSSEVFICVAIKEQENLLWVKTPAAFLVAQRQTGSDASHIADLKVENDQRRIEIFHGLDDISAGANSGNSCLLITKRGINLIKDVVVVGSHKDGASGHPRTRPRSGVAAEDHIAEIAQCTEVGDLKGLEADPNHRCRGDTFGQAGEV